MKKLYKYILSVILVICLIVLAFTGFSNLAQGFPWAEVVIMIVILLILITILFRKGESKKEEQGEIKQEEINALINSSKPIEKQEEKKIEIPFVGKETLDAINQAKENKEETQQDIKELKIEELKKGSESQEINAIKKDIDIKPKIQTGERKKLKYSEYYLQQLKEKFKK